VVAHHLRGTLALGWAGCGALLVLVALPVTVPPTVRFLPFAASLLLFGLPHGAADHVVPARLGAASPSRAAAVVGLLYLLLGALYVVGWLLAPVAAFGGFIALTWYHWGQGDLYALAAAGRDGHLRSAGQRALTLLLRGALPMFVPLVAFPAVYRRVAVETVGIVGATTMPAWVFTPAAGRWLAVTLAALTAGTLGAGAVGALRGGPGATKDWTLDAGETALLWVYFLAVPPILAVGTYFAAWHAVRHVGRLAALADSRPAAGVTAFARDATPLTVVTLVALGALAAALRPATLPALLGVYLLALAVLTLPHVAVVTWMDREQGLWTT
jgi:Brp/Blh family beta-carotene 15,15'-monooxygenase